MISTLISSLERDGNLREVVFTVTDDLGRVHGPRVEFRPIGETVATFLAGQVALIAAALRAYEISQNIAEIVALGELATPRLLYSTAAQNFAVLREAYQTAARIEAVMMADFLSSLSNAQLQAAFGMTAGQVTTLRTNKLTPAAALADQIRASAGQ